MDIVIGMKKAIDWTGKKLHHLTFVKIFGRDEKHNKILWETKCECGNTFIVEATKVKRGKIKSCGCFRKNYLKNNSLGRKYSPVISSARQVWQKSYRDCDFELFYNLSQQPCYYCNRKPHRTRNVATHQYKCSEYQEMNGNFTYNGLDRIDSTKGHIEDNIVPCCTDCNEAKMSKTLDEFLTHIERMYEHTRRLR